ncbi:MAG: 50S ribosomal protein L3 [Parachlamydia sp.]|nr:50S ribosomal protein L3 [Parachlamydia sp.]
MSLKFMGKKRGMTQLFDDQGNVITCTVIEAEPNVVVQVKTEASDGYNAVQLGFERVTVKDPRTMEKRVTKPLRGHYAKAKVEPRRYLLESRFDNVENYSAGQELAVDEFEQIKFVDATAVSKGKGYQGVIKLHHFSGGPASHGSGFHRHAGSTGMRSTPGRCLPNSPRASHMGHERVTVQNLEVVMIDKKENLILVKGAVPGPINGLVVLSAAVKKQTKK